MLLKIKQVINNKVITTGTKELYSVSYLCSEWVRKEIRGKKTFDAPQQTNFIGIKQEGRGRLVNNSLFYLTNVANNVYMSINDVFITSSCSAKASGLSVIPENFRKAIALFTARKTITPNWINNTSEYIPPCY